MARRTVVFALVSLWVVSAAQDDTTNLDSDCPTYVNAEDASLLATRAKVHRGLSEYQLEAASLASTIAFTATAKNDCQPMEDTSLLSQSGLAQSTGCNVCAACCFSYIPNGEQCDACVAQQCPTTTTTTAAKYVCQPSSGCNVCTACCFSYIPDGQQCDACFKQQCSSTTVTTTKTRTTTTTTRTTASTTSSVAVSCSDLKDRCEDSIGNKGVQNAGGCPNFANEFASSCYKEYKYPSTEYDKCTSVIAMIYQDCMKMTRHPYYRSDCKSDVCDEIKPNPNKDCKNIKKVCSKAFYLGPVPYGECPSWLEGFQKTCRQKLSSSECSWKGELLSQQSTGCYNAAKSRYTSNDCVEAAGC